MPPKREQVKKITERDKYLYNTYLRVHRSKQNKPFKYRKNFDKFDDSEYYVHVKRLGMFFKKFPHINIDTFFTAPYDLYPDDTTSYDLNFYASPRAIKVYSLYMKKQDQSDPDTDHHLQFVKDGLMYIFKFCRDNKLSLDDYIEQKTGDIPTFILHLRDRYVSIYLLFGFNNFETKLNSVPKDRLNFTVGESFISSLEKYRTRYYTSIKNKQITDKGIKKIKTLLLTAKNS